MLAFGSWEQEQQKKVSFVGRLSEIITSRLKILEITQVRRSLIYWDVQVGVQLNPFHLMNVRKNSWKAYLLSSCTWQCRLAAVFQHFRWTFYFYIQETLFILQMETVGSSETSDIFCRTACRDIQSRAEQKPFSPSWDPVFSRNKILLFDFTLFQLYLIVFERLKSRECLWAVLAESDTCRIVLKFC